MTISTGFTPFTGSAGGLTSVTPFTHRDNATFLTILSTVVQYLKTTFPAELTANLEALSNDITATKEMWDQEWADFRANTTVEIAILNDAAIKSLVENAESVTRAALDARYPLKTDVDTQLASVRAANPVWVPDKAYVAGDHVLAPNGEVLTAYENHTSGTVFDPSRWYADYGYLFANFTYNSPEGEKLNLFYSADGKGTAGRAPNPVYAPAQGVRDPSVIKLNGLWYMAHGWADPTQKKFSIASSADLLTWTPVTTVDVSGASGLTRAWAPQLQVDTNGDVYAFFTNVVNEGTAHESWYVKATNAGLFTWSAPVKTAWTLAPARCMDATMIRKGDVWYMFYGDNNYICRATAPSLLGPWTTDKTGDWSGWGINKEAPQIVRVSENLWRLYIDRYTGTAPNWDYPGYAYAESTDLTTWTGLTPVKMGREAQGIVLRHGSFVKLNDRVSSAQVNAAIAAGGTAQRYVEGTTGKLIPSGVETNIGPITIDGDGEQRSMVTDDFTFPADGQLKTGSTGVYAFDLHAGDDPVNNFKDTGTTYWVSIFCVTRGKNLARTPAVGGYEATASVSNVRCNAGEIIEFRVMQASGAALPIDCTVRATRIS